MDAGSVVPVSNDVGIAPADKVPTVVNDDVTIELGSVVPVSNDVGISPADKVPTEVILDRFDVEINVPPFGKVTEVTPPATRVIE